MSGHRAELAGKLGRIGSHVLREKVRRPQVRARGDVPRSPTDITPQWLTACLCQGHDGAEAIAVEDLGGSTGTSTRNRVRVTYNEAGQAAGLPADLYIKTTATMTQRLILGLTDIIQVEGRYYDRVRPLLELEAPVGYYSDFDESSWRTVVITEDIGVTRGATFFSPQDEISLEQMKELLSQMAIWHGTMWNHEALDGGWLQTTAERYEALSQFLDWGKRSAVGAKRAGDLVPESLVAEHERVVAAFERSMRLGSEGAHTFIHGDPHAGGNFYAHRDGRMGWADWGVCLRGGWGYDYSYAIAGCLPVDKRREWEKVLLEHYLEALAQAGGEAPEFEDAWLTYRQQLFYPYVGWSAVFGHGPFQPDSQPPEYCLPIIERSATAIEDLGALEAVGV